jgi:hypothetical protein
MILRPDGQGNHRVVGSSFVAGLEDAKFLLGPLPEGIAAFSTMTGGRFTLHFRNKETGTVTTDDPRLPALNEWEPIDREPTNSPYAVLHY